MTAQDVNTLAKQLSKKQLPGKINHSRVRTDTKYDNNRGRGGARPSIRPLHSTYKLHSPLLISSTSYKRDRSNWFQTTTNTLQTTATTTQPRHENFILLLFLALLTPIVVIRSAPVINSFAIQWCNTFNASCDLAVITRCGVNATVNRSCALVFVGNICKAVEFVTCSCALPDGTFVSIAGAVFNTTVARKFPREGRVRKGPIFFDLT